MSKLLTICFFLLINSVLSANTYFAEIIERGNLNVFPEGLKYSDGRLAEASPSAAVFDGEKIIMLNDKPIPGASPIYYINYNSQNNKNLHSFEVSFLGSPTYEGISKYECATQTLDKQHHIFSTGYSTIKGINNNQVQFKGTVCCPSSSLSSPEFVEKALCDGKCYSGLRPIIQKALRSKEYPNGPPYFNAEGIAILPNNKLIMGIRQMGKAYSDFSYVFKIIEATYEMKDGVLSLTSEFNLIYEYDTALNSSVGGHYGISEFFYDDNRKILFILSAFELSALKSDADVGAHLWVLPLEDLYTNKSPSLVMKKDQPDKPLIFAHKMEGLCLVENDVLFVVADDDRIFGRDVIDDPEIQFKRKHNQAGYALAKLGF